MAFCARGKRNVGFHNTKRIHQLDNVLGCQDLPRTIKLVSTRILAKFTSDIKSRTATRKAALKNYETLFVSKLDLNLRKKLIKCYIWVTDRYSAENWTLGKAEQKILGRFQNVVLE